MSLQEPSDEYESDSDWWEQRCTVLNRAWVQIRYHRRRQRFFDNLDKLTKALTVVLGASLFGQWLKEWQPWLASAISALGLFSLVYGYTDRKQVHREMAELAAGLIESIVQVPNRQITAERVAAWEAAFAKLCAKAPPPLKTLTIICEHEQACADGHPEHITLPSWYRCLFAHFF